MALKNKAVQRNLSLPFAVLTGIVCGGAVALLGSVVLTSLIVKESVEISALSYGIIFILLVSTLIGGIVVTHKVNEKQLVAAFVYALCSIAMLFGINALFFDGSYSRILPTVISVLTGSVGAAFLKKGTSGRKTKFRKIKRL